MKINVKELLDITNKVKAGVASSELMEALSYFYFSGEYIISYNDRISVQFPYKTDFSMFVKAKDLQNMLSKLKTDEVIFQENDGKLVITCASTKATLSTISDSEVMKRIESVSESLAGLKKWIKLPENFSQNVLLCSYTSSKIGSEGTLTCVYVNGLDCISSDNNRVSHVTMSSKLHDMLIEASEIKNLVSINPTKVFRAKAWLHFINDEGCIFSIRRKDGEYPDFLEFFEFEGDEVSLPKDLIAGIDIASIFMDAIDPVMDLKITKGKVVISVKSDSGTVMHRAKLDYNGNDISLIINPNFLKEMMSYNSTITIGEDKLKVTTDSGFKMITALYS